MRFLRALIYAFRQMIVVYLAMIILQIFLAYSAYSKGDLDRYHLIFERKYAIFLLIIPTLVVAIYKIYLDQKENKNS